MPTNPVLKEIIKKRETLAMLGQDKGDPAQNVRAALCFVLHTPGTEPDTAQWPFTNVDFEPSDDYRENLLQATAYMVAAIEAGDRQHAKERKPVTDKQENAQARFATVRSLDEVKIRHGGTVVFHGQVGPDGYLQLKGNIRVKAAGITQGELGGIILSHLGLKEE